MITARRVVAALRVVLVVLFAILVVFQALSLPGQRRGGDLMAIAVRIDVEPARRKMSVGEFAEKVGLTPANVAVLKNGRAKAVQHAGRDVPGARLPARRSARWVED